MSKSSPHLPPGHPPIHVPKTGVLLLNLGTPEAPTAKALRPYLKEFLSDPRVIEIPRLVWWPILNLIILNLRPKKSAHAYEQIWNREKNESPLKTFTRAQTDKLRAAIGNDELIFDWAMRYGKPSIHERMQVLKDQGCDRILLMPLYPQYSAATTATALDKVYSFLQKTRWQPAIRTLPPYFDHPAYVNAIAASLKAHLKSLSWKPDKILLAFHGLPKEYLNRGDPYHCHCQKTARLVREKLGLSKDMAEVVFQSRFGKTEWLKPYAQDTVEGLPAKGVKNLVIISPGFSSDCVETLEELSIGLQETFFENGGENFSVVPCLNDSAGSIAMLKELAQNELKGWA